MSNYQTDVAIAGAGLAGRTLANLLCRNGIRCIIIDTGTNLTSATGNTPDPRALAITPASSAILASINIWQRLPADQIGCFEQMQVWDERSGAEVRFDSADICEPALGYIVEQRTLQYQLEQACTFLPDCTIISNARVTGLTDRADGIELTLDQGDRITARLLVAADGSNSPVRKLAGLDYQKHDYRQQAVACVVTTALAHDNIARQRFLRTGPLAFLPLAAPYQCGIVWSTSPEQAQELLAMPEAIFRMNLQQAFEHRLGEISTTTPPVSFGLFDAHAPVYLAGHVVLAGDAAHTVHPLAGQGANLGLLDVAVLAEVILEARQKQKHSYSNRVLRKYERWRKADNLRMQFVLNGLKRLFESENDLLIHLRTFGLNAFDSIPALKSAIMRQAMGLEGDLPAIAKQPVYSEMI